jgi:hypothetical protein
MRYGVPEGRAAFGHLLCGGSGFYGRDKRAEREWYQIALPHRDQPRQQPDCATPPTQEDRAAKAAPLASRFGPNQKAQSCNQSASIMGGGSHTVRTYCWLDGKKANRISGGSGKPARQFGR